jgi:hypothetical protein
LNKEDFPVADSDDRVIEDPIGRRHRQKRTAGDQDVGFFMIGVHRKSPREICCRFAQYTVKFHEKITNESLDTLFWKAYKFPAQ